MKCSESGAKRTIELWQNIHAILKTVTVAFLKRNPIPDAASTAVAKTLNAWIDLGWFRLFLFQD